MKKTALIILDGWGHGENNDSNAIYRANTPFIDSLYKKFPNSELITHGEMVGLPKDQMGNSEVGHMNIGAGRIVNQDLLRINKDIKKGDFKTNPTLLEAIDNAKKNNKTIHIAGLISDGGIHSHINHLYNICDLIIKHNVEKVFIHGFTDGRDTDPKSGLKFVKSIQEKYQNTNVKLASISGRYYAMDRDNRWKRTALAYHALTNGKGKQTDDILNEIKESYNNNITDEFIKPIIKVDRHGPIGKIEDNDIVICFNFRKDRCRQITSVLTQKNKPKYGMDKMQLSYYTMTNYDKSFKEINILYNKDVINNTLGEVISNKGLSQLRIAETEKYPHVTYFFSGGKEKPFKNEKRVLINSPKVATYDLLPAMSSKEVTKACIDEINKHKPDFVCLNYANPDMVGHTGDIQAVTQALEIIDSNVENLINHYIKNDYSIVMIADHGNAEYMINEDGSPNTAHTLNKVPIFLINSNYSKISKGKLADVAPTLLKIMNIDIPDDMTGKVLVND
ncbi:MAG: phosphoglycerate mutase (2,3-diphosphoglycerate-independent) [Flavobacteriales bacterium]|nr:phosphoglycerate mutase (2,3-diphosphoglycerate-independent) [Flavobacteriales bacterium]